MYLPLSETYEEAVDRSLELSRRYDWHEAGIGLTLLAAAVAWWFLFKNAEK